VLRRKAWVVGGLALGGAIALAAVFFPERGTTKRGRDGLTYVRIPAGRFLMGCNTVCEPDEQPSHEVTLTQDFWLAETEVTVEAYRTFVRAKGGSMPPQISRPEADPGQFNPQWRDGDHPIVNVSHDEASSYCRWVGGSLPWSRGDLPTEAQWEFAARGGTAGSSFPWGDQISRDKANYGYKSPDGRIYPRASERGARDRWLFTSPVKSFEPNAFGLYDMVGNVQEWCRDAFRKYDATPSIDPSTAPAGRSEERVVRGGSFLYDQDDSRVENRSKNPPDGRYPDTGFRCVLSVRRLW
jgi:formylglycine-generating enzyme required for sulfatase activity